MNQRVRVLQELGEQLERLAEQERGSRRRAARPRGRLLGVLVTAGVLLLAAVALAASGVFGAGAPVTSSAGFVALTPGESGTVISGSVSGVIARASDPAGSPGWGMRTLRTTRGLVCLQFGRLLHDRLGVLGQDGAFADDGLFHALPPALVDSTVDCGPLDARGHAYLAFASQGVVASDDETGCTPPGDTDPHPSPPICAARDERAVFAGLLGPDATSVSYVDAAGRPQTVPAGPGGAYLIVLPADPVLDQGGANTGGIAPASGDGQPIRRITYRGGVVCRLTAGAPQPGASAACPPPAGYTPPPVPRSPSGPLRILRSLPGSGTISGGPQSGDHYAFPITPDLVAGHTGWCSYPTITARRGGPAVGSGGACGPAETAGSPVILATASDSISFAVLDAHVARLRLNQRLEIIPRTASGLPADWRIAVAQLPPAPPFNPFRPGLAAGLIDPTPLSAAGRVIPGPDSARQTAAPIPARTVDPHHPPNGPCVLEAHDPLAGLTSEWAQMADEVPASRPSLDSQALTSCATTWYAFGPTVLTAAVLVGARDPQSPAPAIPGLASSPQAGDLSARRVGDAWIVVEGQPAALRTALLKALTAHGTAVAAVAASVQGRTHARAQGRTELREIDFACGSRSPKVHDSRRDRCGNLLRSARAATDRG